MRCSGKLRQMIAIPPDLTQLDAQALRELAAGIMKGMSERDARVAALIEEVSQRQRSRDPIPPDAYRSTDA